MKQSVAVKAGWVAFGLFSAALSAAVVVAYRLHQQFCQRCGDRAWAAEQAAEQEPQDGPSVFWSTEQRRDG